MAVNEFSDLVNKDFIEETKRKAKQMSTIFPLVPKGPEG